MELEILASLSDDDRRAVLATATRRRFARRETVFHEGDPGDTVHLLVRGHVAIRSSTPLGDVVTLSVLGPGSYFGELALLAPERRRTASAVALDRVETLVLRQQHFEALCEEQPAVAALLTRMLAQRVEDLSDKLVEALHLPAEQRVARRLDELTHAYADGHDGRVVIDVTQDDVASLAGTTRPTANRALRTLVDRGVIELARNRITVMTRPP